jgi:peptidoglycan/xylan/chitin deacetylase (PgdA/CDA1 family)
VKLLARAKRAAAMAMHVGKRLELPLVDFGVRRTAAIVRYHSISDAADGNHLYVSPAVAMPPAVFAEQVAFMARRYRCVTMDDVHEALARGRSLPDNALVITFDDGYRDNYEAAFPILRAHGVPATFYLTTGCLDGGPPLWMTELRYLVYGVRRPTVVDPVTGAAYPVGVARACERAIAGLKQTLVGRGHAERQAVLAELRRQSGARREGVRDRMLTWSEARKMRDGGMQIGAHTITHPRLPSVTSGEALEELAGCRDELRARLSTAIEHFAYPNPGDGQHWDERIRALVAATGYATAVTSTAGYVRGCDDPLALARMNSAARRRALAWDLEREALRESLRTPADAPERDIDAMAAAELEADAGLVAARVATALARVSSARRGALATALQQHRTLLNGVMCELRTAEQVLDRHHPRVTGGAE